MNAASEDEPRIVQAACDPHGLADELGDEAQGAFLAERAAEIEAMRSFLSGVRTELAAEAAPGLEFSAKRVTRRVLARTTREASGWRGDLALVGDFVVDRLRASAWLRVAVALLTVQVTLIPIVAWHVLDGRAERGAFQLSFERDADGPEFEVPAAESPVVPAPSHDELASRAKRVAEAAARLRVAARNVRAALGDAAFAPAGLAAAPTSERLAALRVLAILETLGEAPAGAVRDAAGALELEAAAREAGGDEPGRDAVRLVRLDVAIDRRLVLGAAPELGALVGECFDQLEVAAAGSHAAVVGGRLAELGLVPPRLSGEAIGAPGDSGSGLLGTALGPEAGPVARAFAAALADR